MYVVCIEHVELAIDRFVNEYEEAPDLIDLHEVKFKSWEPPACCEECKEAARFLVV